jgi:transcriptional regulator with XRE-family HTH domain
MAKEMTTPAKITINQEYANLIPPLSAEEYESLKQSIKQNGLWTPIDVNDQGVVLDGHHRFKACQELGIEPKTVTKHFPDKFHEQIFVIDSNLKRRHLNNFQRTELALKSKSILEDIAKKNSLANLKQKKEQQQGNASQSDRNLTVGISGSIGVGRVDEQIAKKAGVSRDTVRKVEAIQKAVEQKPHLKHIAERARSGEISVNEAEERIRRGEEFDAEEAKNAKWRRLREEVLEQDGRKCTKCGDDLHLDVYPIHLYGEKNGVEDLETLCKDCHELKMNFYEEFGLPRLLTSIFQHLTDISGKRWFQYSIYGSKIIRDRINDKGADSVTTAAAAADDFRNYDSYTKKMDASPYSKLKGASDAELVSNTRKHRELLIETMDKSWYGDRVIYGTQEVLHDLLPILKDYSEMIDKEADARRRKNDMSKR